MEVTVAISLAGRRVVVKEFGLSMYRSVNLLCAAIVRDHGISVKDILRADLEVRYSTEAWSICFTATGGTGVIASIEYGATEIKYATPDLVTLTPWPLYQAQRAGHRASTKLCKTTAQSILLCAATLGNMIVDTSMVSSKIDADEVRRIVSRSVPFLVAAQTKAAVRCMCNRWVILGTREVTNEIVYVVTHDVDDAFVRSAGVPPSSIYSIARALFPVT